MNRSGVEFVRYRLRRTLLKLEQVGDQLNIDELSAPFFEGVASPSQLIRHIRQTLEYWVLSPLKAIEKPQKTCFLDIENEAKWDLEISQLGRTIDDSIQAVRSLEEQEWEEQKRIGTVLCSLNMAILNAVTHCEGQTTQIVLMAKLNLGPIWREDPTKQTDAYGGW